MIRWFVLGVAAGLVSWTSQRISVARLPLQSPGVAKRQVVAGATLRWLLSGVLLASALLDGVVPGLSAFVGLMLARWMGILSLRFLPLPASHLRS